ncbi:MAG: hypothetical protein ACK5QX_06050 [bacterium]
MHKAGVAEGPGAEARDRHALLRAEAFDLGQQIGMSGCGRLFHGQDLGYILRARNHNFAVQ